MSFRYNRTMTDDDVILASVSTIYLAVAAARKRRRRNWVRDWTLRTAAMTHME